MMITQRTLDEMRLKAQIEARRIVAQFMAAHLEERLPKEAKDANLYSKVG